MESPERETQDAGEEQVPDDSGAGASDVNEDEDPTTQPIHGTEGERGAEADL